MLESSGFSECVQTLLNTFRSYDRVVDLVSCWQFFFTDVDPYTPETVSFDRFPRLLTSSLAAESPKTPDFAVLISNSYGLVGDIKEGFPRDETSFLSHIQRLKTYDRPLEFRVGATGATRAPTTHDILLIVPFRDAQEIVIRLERKLQDGEVSFQRNLIVFEWVYDNDEYVFRKVAGQSKDFADSGLPASMRLSLHFSQRGASLKIAPDKIKTIKASWQFCNDVPPAIFTLVFLWTKIFYHLLDENQRGVWLRRDPQKQLPLDITIKRLRSEIEKRYPLKWGHWTDWGREALKTLVTAGLARKLEEDRYVVSFRNLTRELGEPGQPVGSKKVQARPADYARILATYICRGMLSVRDEGRKETSEKSQGLLFHS